jgi:hypothetical protein
MGLLANQRVRSKLLIALAPLAVMVVLAALYSSIGIKKIDTLYTRLLDRDVQAVRDLSQARALGNRFNQILYKMIAEPDIDKVRVTEGELDQAYADYQPVIEEAAQYSPGHAKAIKAIQALFDEAAFAARPVRAAALANQSVRAMQLMRDGVDAKLRRARLAAIDLDDEMQKTVDRKSDDLTVATHHTIVITWLVILIGLGLSFALAFYIVQTAVVDELMSLRGSVQDVADGRLDQPIPFLDRTNEIGEMSRALRTLQSVARERDLQSWVKTEVAATGCACSRPKISRASQTVCCRASPNPSNCCTERSISPTTITYVLRLPAALQSTTLENHGSLPRVRGWWDRPPRKSAR